MTVSQLATTHRALLASSRKILAAERMDKLIHALAQAPTDVTLTIWGDGPDRVRLERLAAAYGLGGRLTLTSESPAREDFRLTFPSPLNVERAFVHELHNGSTPLQLDPGGLFSPKAGCVRTLGELVELLWQPEDLAALRRSSDAVLRDERVVVVSSLPTHYRLPLFESVAERLKTAGGAFRAIFLAGGRPDRDKWMALGRFAFDYEVARSVTPVGALRRRLPLDLIRRIRAFEPTIVVSGGLSLPVSGRIARWTNGRDVVFGVWSGETLTTAAQRRRFQRFGRRRIARAAVFGISYGSASDDYLQSLHPALPVVHARNSTGVRPTCPRQRAGGIRVLAVGRAYPGKEMDLPVRALRRRPALDCTLVVVGDGPELPNILQSASGDSRVSVLGAVSSDQILEHFRAADVFLFPSRIDVFGLVLVEALGSGVATIANRSAGGVADLALEGTNCLVIDSVDPEEWASAIERLVLDADLRRRLGEAGARTISRRWTLAHSAEAFLAGLRLAASLKGAPA